MGPDRINWYKASQDQELINITYTCYLYMACSMIVTLWLQCCMFAMTACKLLNCWCPNLLFDRIHHTKLMYATIYNWLNWLSHASRNAYTTRLVKAIWLWPAVCSSASSSSLYSFCCAFRCSAKCSVKLAPVINAVSNKPMAARHGSFLRVSVMWMTFLPYAGASQVILGAALALGLCLWSMVFPQAILRHICKGWI